MTIADRVREMTESLPADKQAEVLDFVEFLRNRAQRSASAQTQAAAEAKARLRSERFGARRDRFTIEPDFDAPLPQEILCEFEGLPL